MNNYETSPDLTHQIRCVSHEIRNHLSVCDMYTQIIRKNLAKSGIINPSVENALDCIQQSVKIIESNLLDLKSLNRNNLKTVDLQKTVALGVELSKAYIIDKEIVAYATLSPILEEFGENIFNDSSFYCFSRLMVKTGFTKQHIATFLISSMLEEIKAKGIKGCGIMVHPINEKAIKMYQKIGFKFENRREYPYGDFITYSISL